MSAVQARLEALKITLPKAAAPVANYVPYVITGPILLISGQLAFGPGGKLDPAHVGKVGGAVSVEAGRAAAERCAINVLAQIKAALGDLDKVRRCLRITGFVNVAPGFSQIAGVMNGASDLMVAVFGEGGQHVRTTVGVAELPLDSAVEIESMFEIAF